MTTEPMTDALPAIDYTIRSADEAIAAVLDLVGLKGFALEGLLAISEVRWSREIPSACVETATHPRLLLNPDFVRTHCTTPERMAMLVLHELSHLTLAHARMVTRVTTAQNIAFDAVINRSLLQALYQAGAEVQRFADLLTGIYRPDRAPGFLLRPPPGWGSFHRGDMTASVGCPEPLREIHARLYRLPMNSSDVLDVTYGEIVEALERSRGAWDVDGHDVDLLGSHGTTPRELAALTSQAQCDLGSRFAGAFEALGLRGKLGQSGDRDAYDAAMRLKAYEAQVDRALQAAVTRALVRGDGTARDVNVTERPVVSVQRGRDRRGPAREVLARAFGAPRPLFFADVVQVRRPTRATASIYLDVSGSMHDLLPRLRAALAPLRDRLRATLWQFSTVVEPLGAADLRSGRVRSTGGTSIAPVLAHVVAQGDAAPAAMLVLTDGYFDAPPRALVRDLRATGRAIHLAVVGGPPNARANAWAASVQQVSLPAKPSFTSHSNRRS
ncbi:MAG: DUF2201 family putative metallopeptidase [Gemmatimonadota bacterium]